jgi:tRNA(Arg) A34 adenosine deaminase TadA
MLKKEEDFMREAIGLSIENIDNNGGPFGAVIVKDGKVIAKGVNRVTSNNDPTAHAEVNAIRKAAKILETYDLSGCEIYSSCEPCPMCLGAIYWARLDKLYYANTKQDAKDIDFDDSFIYEELDQPIEKRKIPTVQILNKEAIQAFNKWREKEDKIEY